MPSLVGLGFHPPLRRPKTMSFFTGSIARSASRRDLIYSEADFEVFRPAGATCCTDGGEIWHGGGDPGDPRSPPSCQISPSSVQRLGYRTPKTEILPRFDQVRRCLCEWVEMINEYRPKCGDALRLGSKDRMAYSTYR